MREILFKAKRIDNGEWIEGSLVDLDIDSGYRYIVPPYKKASTLPIGFLITDGMELVIPETLCQFTGLCDQCGEDTTEHVYEVVALYPYCVLLRDTRNGVRTCLGYNTLSLMLRGSEAHE